MFRSPHNDKTVEREYTKRIAPLIEDYELIRNGKHPRFKFVTEFLKAHKIPKQTFHKIYHRLAIKGSPLPSKRGPRNPHKLCPDVEREIIKFRLLGLNRFEIYKLLEPKLKHQTPKLTTIYNVFKRHKLNRLTPIQKKERRMIIKNTVGECANIDCLHVSKGTIVGADKVYLLGAMDAASRLVWVEVISDMSSLSAMFATMQCLSLFDSRYQIKFGEIMSDNGSEFRGEPFERLLSLMSIKHYFIKPYRPQTNGKIERFWRTLREDFLRDATFESLEQFKEELQSYLLYYNEYRAHSSLDGLTPKEFCNKISPRNA